jgi:ssDNA-binding Zn-finger/Zn-ribbon topoisomerase 1
MTKRIIKEKGECPSCGGRKLKYAIYRGYNMPRPFEFILLALGLR